MTRKDIEALEQYYLAHSPEVLAPESPSLVSRAGKQLGNLPSNFADSLLQTGQAIGELGLSPDDRDTRVSVPRPFEIAPSESIGESAIDIGLGHLAPELLGALIPYAGVKRLGSLMSTGKLGTEVAAQAAAGAFTGIKESPEEALQQALVGGGLGKIAMMNHASRLLPLAGLTAADAAWNYTDGASPTELMTQSGLNIAFGLLPGSIDALRGRKVSGASAIEADEIIPPPTARDRRALRLEGPEYGPQVIAPEFSGRPQLMPQAEREPRLGGNVFIDMNSQTPIATPYMERAGNLPAPTRGMVYPFEQELPQLTNQFRETAQLTSPVIDIPYTESKLSFSEIFTGPKPPRPSETFGRDLIVRPDAPASIPTDPIIAMEMERNVRDQIARNFNRNAMELPPENYNVINPETQLARARGKTRPVPFTEEGLPPSGTSGDLLPLPVPEQNPAKGKIPVLPEYMRTHGGGVQFPILSGGIGGVVGGALPADSDEERLRNVFLGMGIGAAGGHALSSKTNKIGAVGDVRPNKPKKIAGISLVDSEGRELSKAPIGKTHGDIKAEALDKFYADEANLEKDPFSSITHAFHDDDGKILTRQEAFKIAKENGQLNEQGLRKVDLPNPVLESQDLKHYKQFGKVKFEDDKGGSVEYLLTKNASKGQPYPETPELTSPEDLQKEFRVTMMIDGEPYTHSTYDTQQEAKDWITLQKKHKSKFLTEKQNDIGAFANPHLLSTVAGAGIGGEEGYRQSGGDPQAALAGAIMGGAGGFFGYKAIEALTRPNPRLKGGVKEIKTEIKGAAKAMMEKKLVDLAGEDVRGRGGIMSKFIRSLEHWGRLHLPEEIKTAWTQARGTGVLGVQAVKDSLDALKGFKPTPEIAEAAGKFIDGQFLDNAKVLSEIKAGGGVSPEVWDGLDIAKRPKNWGVWKVKVGDETATFRISPETRVRLMNAEEEAFKKALGTENEMYFKFVNTARKAIDNLQHIYADGMPDGHLKRMIEGSTGQYVTRTYKIFNDKRYEPTEPQIEAAMREYGEFLDSKGIEHTRDYLRSEIEQYLHDIRIGQEAFGISSRNKIDTTMLKEREELSPTFRELLGEYTDPKERLLQAISRLYPSAQASRFISLTKDMNIDGMPGAMTKEEWVQNSKQLEELMEKADPEDLKHYKEKQRRLNEYADVPKNLKYGGLKGMKVNRFIADQLMDYEGPLGMAAHPIMRGVNNWTKVVHTVYDPIRHVRNLVTTPMFLWMGRASTESTQQAWDILRKKSGTSWKEMVSNGILTADQVSSEFRGKMDEVFNGHYDSELTKKVKSFHTGLLELYRFPDLVVRAATYLEAKSRYSKQMKLPIDHEDVIRKAVEWTDERTMNYDNIAPAVRLARQLPFFNLYISYTAEITRIMKNVGRDAMKGDIHALAQIGTLAGAFEGAQAISEAMLSAKDREDWKRSNAQSPAYSRSRYKIVTGRDSKGNFKYLDVTPWIPTDNINQMIRSAAKGDMAGLASINPIVGLDNTPAFKLISETVSGRDNQTKRDFRDKSDYVMNVVQELSPSLTPGIGYEWKKISSIGQENIKTGRSETWGGTITRYVTGANYTSVNPTSTQRAALAEAKRHIANEKAYLNDVLKMKGTSQEQKERAVKKYQEAVATVLETFRNKSDPQSSGQSGN